MVSADDRGQAFTLEGFVAALLLVATVAFVVQATAVTPLSASTSSQHAETQTAAMVGGVLDAAAANESIKPTLLYWNESAGTFHGAETTGTYTNCDFAEMNATFRASPNSTGALFNRSFYDQGFACNVNVWYLNDSTELQPESQRLVYSGTPSDNAVRAVRTVTLYDDDRLRDEFGQPTTTTLSMAGANETFYAPDAVLDSPIYAVVEVEVIVWRT